MYCFIPLRELTHGLPTSIILLVQHFGTDACNFMKQVVNTLIYTVLGLAFKMTDDYIFKHHE